MTSDDPLRAIALAVSATVLFGSSDTISKYLSASLPIVEFLWIRYVIFLLLALGLAGRVPAVPSRARNPGFNWSEASASPGRPCCSCTACAR